ncbi:MAG TPA: magnesium transporter [Gammaproteobacteria bacterium]|nr:magnesium transporter [Xanthomonadales bacterium]HPI95229.1 magnesium transporter [Gammaproteobacteria bacterium]HPQ87348.1 magnesium transporter [Gammaproteobacteria bacterium]
MSEAVPNEATEKDIHALNVALDDNRMQEVERMINSFPAAEIAFFLESLPCDKRNIVWELADSEHSGEILVHLHDEVRSSLIASMENEELVEATADLELDDLADIIQDLPKEVSDELLLSMDRTNRELLKTALSYPENSAGGLMNPDVITIRPDVTLDVVLRYIRMRGSLPEPLGDLFAVGRNGHYRGRLNINDLFLKDPNTKVADILDMNSPAILAKTPASEVAQDFQHYDWISAPVVDENNTVIGRITVDDVVDVIRDESEHSVMRMAGLDEENDMFAPVLKSSKRRALWLGINLLTVLLAAYAIGFFSAALEQIVALAILMPVVASMGGIAGSQTLTLMIRGMATGQVGLGNAKHLLSREVSISIINSFIWALVLAAITFLWFRQWDIGLVIGIALTINLVAGAFAGVMVPIILRRMSIDPAIAGGVVLTTVTDIVGYVSFLALGNWLLLN